MLTELGSWQTVEEIFARGDADVRIARQGALAEIARPSFEHAQAHFREGYTIFVRHAERHHAGLAELAAAFAADLAAPIDVHLFCTPANTPGFGWHYDAEEVFILQTLGVKHYQLRKNTVNPWPLIDTLPDNMRYEREIMPLVRCTLAPGDWLYLPNGYWHQTAAESDSISLAIGALAPAALDLIDFLRGELLESLLWRQRLPCTGAASTLSSEKLRQQLDEIAGQLQSDLTKRLADPELVKRYLATRSSSKERDKGG